MLDRLGDEDLRGAVIGYRDALRAHRDYLNRLNVYPVPDGDTGTNMALTLESVVAEMEGAADMAATCRAISHGSLMGARGNSGVILSQVLRGLTDVLKDNDEADAKVLAAALTNASATAYEAVMRPVEGTILTVVREASEAAAACLQGPSGPSERGIQASLVEVLDAAAGAARLALEETPKLLPVLAEAGVVDAGGAGFVLLLEVLLHVAADRPVPEPPAWAGEVPAVHTAASHESQASDDLRFEVMYLLEAPDESISGFKETWAGLGDSIVVTGGDGLWNCHIHTNDVGGSIEAALDAGRPRRIQVTDLCEAIDEERWVRAHLDSADRVESSTSPARPGPVSPARPGRSGPVSPALMGRSGPVSPALMGRSGPVSSAGQATGVVAVGAGEGVGRILRSLGVGSIVAGGQAMNPSTREILAAVEEVDAEDVVVVPNNRNIVPVARQVDALTSKSVRVVETASVAEGFAALLGYDPDAELEVNVRAMIDAAASVVTGEVTQAVRDATTPAGPVRTGDHLGITRDGIVAVAPSAAEASCALLEQLVGDHHEIVTIIEGAGASDEATRRITDWLTSERPKASSEVHRGDQPLSSYLFSVE